MGILNKMFGNWSNKAKLTQAITQLLVEDVLSPKSKQIVQKTPELLAPEAGVFLKDWMDAYDLSDDEGFANWVNMFMIRLVLDHCRKEGIDAAYAKSYPDPQDALEALDEIFDVEIMEEHLPRVLKNRPILLSDFTLELLRSLINSPKKLEDFEAYESVLEILESCRANGIDEQFSVWRRDVSDPQLLAKIFSQRPKTIEQLATQVREYPFLLHPKFIAGFQRWADALKNPLVRDHFLARIAFLQDVTTSGYEAACAHAQANPHKTMLRDTVVLFLLSDSIEDARDMIQRNRCLLLAQALVDAKSVIQEISQQHTDTAHILQQRLDFLALCHQHGLEQAFQKLSVLVDRDKLEKTLDPFFEGDWSDPEQLLQENPELTSDEFLGLARRSVEMAAKDNAAFARELQERIEIIEVYRIQRQIKQNRRENLDRLMTLIHEFVSAHDVKKMFILVDENPILMSDTTQKLLENIANTQKDTDQGFYLFYKTRQNLLLRCKEIGPEQAFAEYRISPEALIPVELQGVYGPHYERIEQVRMDWDPDVLLKIDQHELDDETKYPEILREALANFIHLQDDREVAQTVLDNPGLLSSLSETLLKKYLLTLTEPEAKRSLERKLLLLQTCRQQGVRSTLAPFL